MDKKIIEINGIKLEVDLRTAEVSNIETFKVGDSVKLLMKRYSKTYESYPGVIVGFDNFKDNPTIIVMYLENDYSEAKMKMAYINASEDAPQICKASEDDILFSKDRVVENLNKAIEDAKAKVLVAESNKELFYKWFDRVLELRKKSDVA